MIGIVLGTLVGLSSSFGSAPVLINSSTAPSHSMSICGKNLELGMPPGIIFKEFDGSECVMYKTDDPDLFAIKMRGSPAEQPAGTVKFSHGLLTEITREWAIDAKNSDDVAKAVIDALQPMEAQGASQCVISTHNNASPSSEDRISELKCGQRTLVFVLSTRSGQKEIQIEEILSN